ncbi:MAG: hypothetical protein RQ741_07185 [Wenzhouxiangellaceae bacterium]|nr:hypothetical protein [Wenzhouxiangellaceae bacterium]
MAKSDAPGAMHLAEQIRHSQQLLDYLEQQADAYPRLDELQHWQRARLRETYSDLRSSELYKTACVFFLEELYGGRDMRERDRELERVLPIMQRFLPDHLLHAIGEAMRLQYISMDLDSRLSQQLEGPLDQREYSRAYRSLGMWSRREEQIGLIGDLGHLLERTVKRRMIRRLVRWMHGPAVAAGFGMLQQFLMDGLDAFAQMGDSADYFVETIVEREHKALAAMRAGEDWPFAEWIGHGPKV